MSFVLITECSPLLPCDGATDDRHTTLFIGGKEAAPHSYPRKDTYEPILCDDYFMSGGLALEELLPYSDDRWWHRLRQALLCTLCLTWLLAFATAIVLAFLHSDRCRLATSAYGVLPTSFSGTFSPVSGPGDT